MATITRNDIAEIWDSIADRREREGLEIFEDLTDTGIDEKVEAARFNAATIRETASGLFSKGIYDFR